DLGRVYSEAEYDSLVKTVRRKFIVNADYQVEVSDDKRLLRVKPRVVDHVKSVEAIFTPVEGGYKAIAYVATEPGLLEIKRHELVTNNLRELRQRGIWGYEIQIPLNKTHA